MSDHPYPLLPLNDAETATTIAAMNDGISAVGAHLVIQVLRQNGWQSAPDAAVKDAEIERLTGQLNAQAEAMRELDDKATEAYEARDAALHDLDEEARTAVSLRKELDARKDDHALVEAFVAEQLARHRKRVLPTTTAIGCVNQLAEVLTERAEKAEIQWRRLRDRMHGLAQQWRGGRAPGPEFGQALEAALDQLKET